MVNGRLIIQSIRVIVHQNISQDTRLALYEKMLLINEQEYLTLKNARYRVGEPEGEEDEYHMGGDDEEYSEFGDAYSYYGDDDDDDDDYGDDDMPVHPFRYQYQPTPHVENAPLAEEEVVEQEVQENVEQIVEDLHVAQENVEEVEQFVENAVEELHVAQENVEHAENDVQLEQAENQREEAVEHLAVAEEQLDVADNVLANVQYRARLPTPPDDSEIDLDISNVREMSTAQDDPGTWQLANRLKTLWNPHGNIKQFTHDPFARRIPLKMKAKTPEPEIQASFKQWKTLKGKGKPMNISLDVEYDPVNRSLIEMIPHPQYPPPPSEYSEPSEHYIGQTPPTSPEPIESILERHEGPRLTPREEDYNISYQDIITPPRQKGLTIKPVIRQTRLLSRTPPRSPETVQDYDPTGEPPRASTPISFDIRDHIAIFEPLVTDYLHQVAPIVEQRENEFREHLATQLINTVGADEFYENHIMDNIIENTIAAHPVALPVLENVDEEFQAMAQYVHDQENARERFIEHNKTRYNIPYDEHVVDLDAIVPPQLQLSDADLAELHDVIENMRDPYDLQNLTINLEEAAMLQYEEDNRAPPEFPPPAAIVAPQYITVQHYKNVDDDTLPLQDELDTEFDISFGNIAEKYHQPITDLQMVLVRTGLLVKGGIIMADGTLLSFNMGQVLKYFVIDSAHLKTVEQQFIANAKNLEAAQIIVEFAREHPELYRHFGFGVKKVLRREYGHNVPDSLKKHQGRKAERPIYERVMHDQPIIAPMPDRPLLPEARVILERIKQRTPIRHNVEHLAREVATEHAIHRPTTSNPVHGTIPSPHRKRKSSDEDIFIPSSPSAH